MDLSEVLGEAVDHAVSEPKRLRELVRNCDAAARRALATARDESDGARADRYLMAATRLVAMRDVLMCEAEDALLAGGRALPEIQPVGGRIV